MTTSVDHARSDARKTKKLLIEELQSLRQRVRELEQPELAATETDPPLLKILDNSPIGVVASRISDGAILFFNSRLAELFGLDQSDERAPSFSSCATGS